MTLFVEGSCGNDKTQHLWEVDTLSQIWVWEAHFLQLVFYKHLKTLLNIRGLWRIKQINNNYALIGCSWKLYTHLWKLPHLFCSFQHSEPCVLKYSSERKALPTHESWLKMANVTHSVTALIGCLHSSILSPFQDCLPHTVIQP